MRWLVTGASGFLGRYVVQRLLADSTTVRVLLRQNSDRSDIPWMGDVEVFRGDLLLSDNLVDAFDDVDGVIHLAAMLSGDTKSLVETAVTGTKRLLAAMSSAQTQRIVHVSSMSVYNWSLVRQSLDERAELETAELPMRDGYAIAKAEQERLVRSLSESQTWKLTVLRPGYLWGKERMFCPGLGQELGPFYLTVGPRRMIPLSHVANCADAIVAAAGDPAAAGETFNVVDDPAPCAWQVAKDFLVRSAAPKWRIPVPYHIGLLTAQTASALAELTGQSSRLPGVLNTKRYVARFKSSRFPNSHLKQKLSWSAPLSYEQALKDSCPGTDDSTGPGRVGAGD